jgi:hypothetical protein
MDAAQREFEILRDHATTVYTEELSTLGRAAFDENWTKVDAQTDKISQLLSDTMVLFDLHGRRRILIESDKFKEPTEEEKKKVLFWTGSLLVFRDQPVVPRVPFGEAVKDLLSREPRLKRGYKEVQEAYSKSHVFALAKKAREETVSRVQDYIAGATERGTGTIRAGKVIARIGGWSESYGRMVYRTNGATAYSGGRFQQAFDIDVRAKVAGFELVGMKDADTRKNHAAAHGLFAPCTHQIWQRFSSPLGYN